MSDNDTNMEPFDGIKESHQKSPIYLNILYFALITWAIIFMGYYLFSGWSSHDEFQEKMNAHQEQTSPEQQSGGY